MDGRRYRGKPISAPLPRLINIQLSSLFSGIAWARTQAAILQFCKWVALTQKSTVSPSEAVELPTHNSNTHDARKAGYKKCNSSWPVRAPQADPFCSSRAPTSQHPSGAPTTETKSNSMTLLASSTHSYRNWEHIARKVFRRSLGRLRLIRLLLRLVLNSQL